MITKTYLLHNYAKKGKSMQQIASQLNCSVNAVVYWMKTYGIKRRKMSDAIYVWHNPNGDPFKFRAPKTPKEHYLMGLGIGLYWGEGTKADLGSIRLGNTDPELLNNFIKFLIKILGVKKKDLKFGLQIFTDIDPHKALDFWTKSLKVSRVQFQKPIITISGSIGTYRRKSRHGVVTVHYNNKKARNLLVSMLPM